jgi:hypothetical protein
VTAQLVEVPEGAIFERDLYDYATILRYRVLKVHRGERASPGDLRRSLQSVETRTAAADKRVKGIGGTLKDFRAGDTHRMALEVPIDDHFMGGIVNKYFGKETGPLYWAVWTNESRTEWFSPPTSSSSIFCRLLLGVYYALPLVVNRLGGTSEAISRARNLWLLFMSYVFYGWWNPWFILLMFFVTAANYLCGHFISHSGATANQRRFWLVSGGRDQPRHVGFFKYFVFFQINLNYAFAWFGLEGMTLLRILLPVGISFYTFQALSYSVDVYRGDAPPARSLADFACYIALFPQLIAGPIIRYHTWPANWLPVAHPRAICFRDSVLFVLGFAKKILLANPIGRIADTAFAAESLTAVDAWFG